MKKLKTYVHLYFFLSVWNTHIFIRKDEIIQYQIDKKMNVDEIKCSKSLFTFQHG
jgi:hypothetical protein